MIFGNNFCYNCLLSVGFFTLANQIILFHYILPFWELHIFSLLDLVLWDLSYSQLTSSIIVLLGCFEDKVGRLEMYPNSEVVEWGPNICLSQKIKIMHQTYLVPSCNLNIQGKSLLRVTSISRIISYTNPWLRHGAQKVLVLYIPIKPTL